MKNCLPSFSPRAGEGGAERDPGLVWGVALWLLLGVVLVLLRGVRWDETFEHAQVITGQVAYPEGHPLRVYVTGAYSLQTYLSAALMALGAGPSLLCGLRNVLFLWATVLPPFLLGALLSRRALLGHMAALFMLEGVMLEFDGSYPTVVWPEFYSNGHIGGAVALLCLCAVVAGRTRMAAFIFGLMPCIHIGQWPVLLGLFPAYMGWRLWRGEGKHVLSMLPFLGAGLLCCIAFALVQRGFAEPLPESGPFAASQDTEAVWKGYTFEHDPHRQFPPANGHIIMVASLLVTAGAALRLRGAARERFAWVWLYCAGVAAAVWGTMALHGLLREDTPFLFVAWMPYRMVNHLPPIALAASVAAVGFPKPGRGVLMILLLVGLLHPLLAHVLSVDVYARYVSHGEIVAYAVMAMAWWRCLAGLPLQWRAPAVLLPVAALATVHQFGAACMLVGYTLVWAAALRTKDKAEETEPAPPWMWVTCIGVCILLMHGQFRLRPDRLHGPLPREEWDCEVAHYLAEIGEGDAMILAEPFSYHLQARTGHPILAEAATPSLISYLPGIGPAINRLYEDLYGLSYEYGAGAPERDWREIWAKRDVAEWRVLAERYGIRWILVPTPLKLALPTALEHRDGTLYHVAPSNPNQEREGP